MTETVLDGILIGGAGGAIAGLTVWLVDFLHKKTSEATDKRLVYQWLKSNTRPEEGHQFRSTRAVASWTNLTEERVRHICSIHPKIYLSTGPQPDMWSLYERGDRSVYERRGPVTI